ncbi:MAG: YtxH domain-containing protein [Ginsengibacter sp.]
MNIIKAFAAGIFVGILFAPDRGTKTRKKIVKIFSDYKEDAKDYIVDVADNLETEVRSAKKAVKKF